MINFVYFIASVCEDMRLFELLKSNNMKWYYKNIEITIQENGKFYFSINNLSEAFDSLDLAKNRIDHLLKNYYTFNKKDIDILCKKLNRREKEFVLNMIDELKIHRSNAYCEIGLSDEFLFTIEE